MSIITKENNSTSTPEDEIQAPLFEGYAEEDFGLSLALQESFEDQLAVIEAIHAADTTEIQGRYEIRSLKESGASEEAIAERESVIESAIGEKTKSVVDNLKKILTNLWGKLTSFFNSAIQLAGALTTSSEKFIEKYKDKLKESETTPKYTGYEYAHIDEYTPSLIKAVSGKEQEVLQHIASMSLEKLKEVTSNFKANKDNALAALRGRVLASGGELSADEFKAALYAFFRGGAKQGEKKEVTVSADEIIKVLSDKSLKERIGAMKKEIDASFKSEIKSIDDIKNAIKKTEYKDEYKEHKGLMLEVTRNLVQQVTMTKTTIMTAFNAWKTAYGDRNRDYKSAVLHALSAKGGQAATEE